MSERVLTVGGNKATRPITDFMIGIAGTEFYVGPNATGAGDDGRSGRSKETSLATLEAAIALATASKNDIIYLLPGHTETVATAGAISLDKIGLRVIGLGTGALRPTFTFSATDSTITLTAASCELKNIIVKPSIDNVVSPIVVSAADCKVDFECQEASATVQCTSAFLTTAGADRLDLKLKHVGFIAGAGCVNAIRLVGVDTAKIDVDFYGVASTAIVEFHTTECYNIDIKGYFYNSGTTDLSKNVIDTKTGGTWFVKGYDGAAGGGFSGGSGQTIAGDDISTLSAAVATAQADLDILTGATGANLLTATQASVDAIEVDTGTTIPGTIATVQADLDILTGVTGANLLTATQASIDAIEVDTSTTIPATITTAQNDLDIITGATGVNLLTATQASIDAIEVDTSTTIPATITTAQNDLDIITGATGVNLLTATQASIDAIEVDTGTTLPATLAAIPQCVVKADGAVLAGLDPIFTVSGGPVRCKIVGLVTTAIGADATNLRLQHITTDPAATVELNAGAVAATSDAAGTFYYNVGATSVFTPSAGLGFLLANPVTVEEVEFLLAPGVVQCLGSVATTGVIAWYITFTPLSPLSVVTAAA